MEKFSGFKWNGKCSISNPARTFWIIQNWELVEKDGSSYYDRCYFGKEIVKPTLGSRSF